jgi:hypothetical protein
MGVIVKLAEDKYLDWSGVCDAPLSGVMTKAEVVEHVKRIEEHALGYKALENAEGREKELMLELMETKVSKRLQRVEETGTSSMLAYKSARDFLKGNRAGPKETNLTLEEIIETYTYTPEKRGKWPFT